MPESIPADSRVSKRRAKKRKKHSAATVERSSGTANGRILVVDDEPEICTFVDHYLCWLGYQVRTADNVRSARELLAAEEFDLVLTDLWLGGSTGLDLLEEIRSRAPRTRVILMSANADVQSAAAAIDRGIDHLLLKPFEPSELQARVAESISRRRAADASARERRQLLDRLQRAAAQGDTWVRRAAHSLASAVEAKDRYTAGHAQRVCAYAMVLVEETPEIDPERFRLACELHDLGKIGVPDEVLNRPTRLTEEEFALVIEHPIAGARILEPLIDDELVIGAVRWHHERWDGNGYPDRLAEEEIPLAARVLAVADTLDALTSSRAYRGAEDWDSAVAEIRRCSGTQFDPCVVAIFDRMLPRLRRLYEEFRGQEE